MYADRYAPRRLNRGSLGLSVGIVGALIAVAMTSNTVRTAIRDKTIEIYPVRLEPPPKPEPLPRPQPRTKAQPSPAIKDPIVKVPVTPDKPYVAPPDQPFAGTTGTGDSAVITPVIDPPKPPPPVLTGSDIDPRYARDFQPMYPPAEQRAGRDGVVTLKVLIGIDGRVVRAEQLMATSDEFWRVTLKQALGRWRFKPATRDGVPYESWRTMTVRFRLDDQ